MTAASVMPATVTTLPIGDPAAERDQQRLGSDQAER